MGFMEKKITKKQRWLCVETTQGTEFVNVFDSGLDLPNSEFLAGGVTEENSADLQQFCEGHVQSWTNIEGYGARLSAPGYLDCTEWTVFDTAEQAEKYLEETYGDDEEDSEDETENEKEV